MPNFSYYSLVNQAGDILDYCDECLWHIFHMTFLIIVHSRTKLEKERESLPYSWSGKTMNLICVYMFMIRHLSFHVNCAIEKTFGNEIVYKGSKDDDDDDENNWLKLNKV